MPRQTRSKAKDHELSRSSSSNDATPVPSSPVKDDKENVKKMAFQPPSPLTSKRRKDKISHNKNILSPNRNNQWSHHEDPRQSSRAISVEDDRRITYQHQNRDPRDRQSLHPNSTMKRDMNYSLSGDLDLMRMKSDDDQFGPSIEDCLNLGSFAEESPPREKGYRRSEARASPTYQGGYYPPQSSTPSEYQRQPPMYYSHPPAPGYSYQGYHPQQYGESTTWQSPRPYAEYGRGPPQHHNSAPPRGSYDMGSPNPNKSRRWDEAETPDKNKSKNRSPFRSPMANPESSKKPKRSPIWAGTTTPNIGMYGSFGMMDTPGAQLDGFSPMGPSFNSFENDSPPLPMEGEVLDARLSLVAGDDVHRAPSIRQRHSMHPPPESPGFNFMNEMAHMPGTMPVPGSPMMPSRERSHPRYFDGGRSSRGASSVPQLHAPPSSHPPVKRPAPGTVTKRHIFTSPLAPSHHLPGSSRRGSWYDHSRTDPGPLRLQIGDVGARASETRRSLEGINSMMRAGAGHQPRPSPPSHNHPGAPMYDHSRGSPYHSEMNTPQKMGGSGPPPSGMMTSSQSRGQMPYPGSASMPSRKVPPPMSSSTPRYALQPSPSARPPSSGTQRTSQSITPPVLSTPATEKKKISNPSKRSPCNCKKSKCLKLYCECFAAELYCDGCNCNDCRNTKTHEDVRSKAMKDTRAKNPNAFKPRIATRPGQVATTGTTPSIAHNMGCKCKRSECLKKYCECFQAGVMCGNKCKCVDCLNYGGSQALIDKRRKIKDHRGADFAMRIADEAWKGKHNRPPSSSSREPVPSGGRRQSPPPARATSHGHHLSMPPHMMQQNPNQHHLASRQPPPPYMGYPPPYGQYPPPVPYGTHSGRSEASRPTESTKPLVSATPDPRKQSEPNPSTASAQAMAVERPVQKETTTTPRAPITTLAPMKNEHREPPVESTPIQSSVEDSSLDVDYNPEQPIPSAATSTPAQAMAVSVESKTAPAGASASSVASTVQVKVEASAATIESHTAPAEPSTPSVASTLVPATAVTIEPHAARAGASTPPIASTPVQATAKVMSNTRVTATPKTPGIRLGYDPSFSKKKRRVAPGQKEDTYAYFGSLPEQPKTTALAVLAYLTDEEICNARLVSKQWSALGVDEELWQF